MKTKYATEAAEAFKKWSKTNNQKKGGNDGKEFLGAFKQLCNKRGFHLYSTFNEKSLLLLIGTSDRLKK